MHATTRAVLNRIDERSDDLVASLVDMIRTPSVNPSFDPGSSGEAAMADLVTDRYARLGVEVERVEDVPGRPNVIAHLPGTGTGPKLLVNCHLDTVPADVGEWYDPFTGEPAGPWQRPPFGGIVEEGRIHGRGAADHKSPIAALLHALEALDHAGVRLLGDLTCIHDADEETGGGHGMQYLADTRPFEYDMVLYACSSEFTPMGRRFFDAMGQDNIVRAFAGWHTYRIRVSGRNLHNLTPRRGLGAIEAALPLLDRLRELQARVNDRYDPLEGSGQPTFRVSSVDCGPRAAFHHQARWCEIVVNRRLPPSVSPDAARAELEDLIDAHNTAHPDNPATLEVARSIRAFETPADHPVVTGLAAAVREVTGREPTVTGLPAPVGISALLNRCPLPTVLFGYGYLNMHHAPNEHIDVEALVAMAKVYAVALTTWLGVGPEPASPATSRNEGAQ